MQGALDLQFPDRQLTPRAVFELLSSSSETSTEASSRASALAEGHHHKTDKRRLIGVAMNAPLLHIHPDSTRKFAHPFFDDVLFGIRSRADAGGLDLLLLTGVSSDITGEETHYAELCHRHGAEGLIAVSFRPEEPELSSLVASGFPCVTIETQLIGERVAFICSDNVGGAIEAVHHLSELGRTRIAFIGGYRTSPPAADRRLGYESALRELGLELREQYILDGNWLQERAYELMVDLLALPEPPDALFCASDVMAIGAIAAIEDAGLCVPDDIAVVGFGDADIARLITPSLTSVRQDLAGLGTGAIEAMLRMLDEPDTPPPVSILSTELVVRESTTCRAARKDVLDQAALSETNRLLSHDDAERLSVRDVYRSLGKTSAFRPPELGETPLPRDHKQRRLDKRRLVAIALDNAPNQSFRHALFDELFIGIRALAYLEDIDLLLFTNTGTIPESPFPPMLELCRERRADGAIIVALVPNDPAFVALVESGFPCVLVDIDMLSNSVAFVMSDNVDGATKIVRHLGELGRERIAFIGGRGFERPHVDRHFGYQSELARLGLEYRSDYVATANWLPEPAYAEMERMLTLPEPPDAVFCTSDVMAIAAMAAIGDAGLRIPEDVAVVGFDDIEYARLVSPTLTTVRQDRGKIAEAVMDAVLNLLEHPQSAPPVSLLPIELIVRESSAGK